MAADRTTLEFGTFTVNDEELYVTAMGAGTILSGLIFSETRWHILGITVRRWYDPESSPPRLVSRVVNYD